MKDGVDGLLIENILLKKQRNYRLNPVGGPHNKMTREELRSDSECRVKKRQRRDGGLRSADCHKKMTDRLGVGAREDGMEGSFPQLQVASSGGRLRKTPRTMGKDMSLPPPAGKFQPPKRMNLQVSGHTQT